MKSKRKFLISALAVVLTAALAVGVFFFYKAFKKRIDPEDQMIHSTQERIEYAQSCYKEFSKNPNKTYTVLVSLDSVTTEEFTQLFAGCSGFTQVYDCITEGVDDPMYGGYLDCEGKTAAQLAAECYADTYDSICSELDSYDQQAAEIRESYMYDETVEPFATQPPVDTFGKDIDTSDIKVPGSSYSNDERHKKLKCCFQKFEKRSQNAFLSELFHVYQKFLHFHFHLCIQLLREAVHPDGTMRLHPSARRNCALFETLYSKIKAVSI